jgi:hypothetical protein
MPRPRVRFLLRLKPPGGGTVSVRTVKSLSANLGVRASNPKWTSYGALEVDLFADSAGDIELCIAALEPLGEVEFARNLSGAPPFRTLDETVREARSLFGAERYWECHEALEGAWMSLEGDEKRYVQGVILVCAAFVHHQKGEDATGLSVLRRASALLSYPAPEYHGIGVGHLARSVDGILAGSTFEPFSL